jgi:hypothetical protein
LLGTAIILFSLFAVEDYTISLAGSGPSAGTYEAATVANLRSLATAELGLSKPGTPNSDVPLVFATPKELEDRGSVDRKFSAGRIVSV